MPPEAWSQCATQPGLCLPSLAAVCRMLLSAAPGKREREPQHWPSGHPEPLSQNPLGIRLLVLVFPSLRSLSSQESWVCTHSSDSEAYSLPWLYAFQNFSGEKSSLGESALLGTSGASSGGVLISSSCGRDGYPTPAGCLSGQECQLCEPL